MRRENMWKAVISGVLVLTLVVTGITLYSTGKEDESKEKQNKETQTAIYTEKQLNSQQNGNG